MMILFFTRRFWPSIGGVEKHVLMLSMKLIQKGNRVVVVTESDNASVKFKVQSEKFKRINIYRIPITVGEKLKKFQIWWWLWENRRLIKEADIVHCHDVFFWYFPFRFLYPKKKVFTTFHGWEGVFPPRWQAKLMRRISEKLSLGNICVGDYISKWYGTKTDGVTYGGVDLVQSAKFKAPNYYNLKFKILFIGRLEKDTGVPIYLRAIEQFSIFNFQFSIRFAGDGSLRKEAEKHGKVLGFVENIGKYIKEANFVFTSGYLSILEAMAEKKLVFAVYDNPLKEDYLKMSPFKNWIVVENDPQEIARKLQFYLENPKYGKKLVEEAYNWVKEQSWEKLAGQYLNLWSK